MRVEGFCNKEIPDSVHTIEMSAYTKLKSERDAAVEALKFYASCPDKGLMEPAISGQEFAPMGERARAVLAMIDKGEK